MSRRAKEFPCDPVLIQFARQNRQTGNPAEVRLWKNLLSIREITHYKWTRQKPVLHYILDFYCAGLMLAIEVDGDSHAERAAYDTLRTRLLQEFSTKVLRYTNEDIRHSLDGVWEDLKHQMQTREKELGLDTRFIEED